MEYPFRTSRETHAYVSLTLAYTDYAGAYGARRCLVNALWLTVLDDTGAVVAGGGDGTAVVDNVQQLVFTPARHGAVYTARVTGTISAAQPFALVMVGAAAAGTGASNGVGKRLFDSAALLVTGLTLPTGVAAIAVTVVVAVVALTFLVCVATWCCRRCRRTA